MQVYRGLPIVTNVATEAERCGVPHHVLEVADPLAERPYTVHDYLARAMAAVADVSRRGKLPVIVGGTNYYVEALLFRDALAVETDEDHLVDVGGGTAAAGGVVGSSSSGGGVIEQRDDGGGSASGAAGSPVVVPTPTTHGSSIFTERDSSRHANRAREDVGGSIQPNPPAAEPSAKSATAGGGRREAAAGVSEGAVHEPTLHEQLAAVDPVMAERLHPNDVRKVARSLEIFHEHGVPHSAILAQQCPSLRFGSVCCVWVGCDQGVLDSRLDRRVDDMLAAGLIPELEAFHSMCEHHRVDNHEGEAKAEGSAAAVREESVDVDDGGRGILQAIGFKEFAPYLAARSAKDPSADTLLASCVDTMKQRTRRYARKQTRWIVNRMLAKATPGMHTLRVDSSDPLKWDEMAAAPAAQFVQSWLDGTPLVGNCGDLVRPEPAEPWRKYECKACDRVLNGVHEWEAHLKSRQHRGKRKRSLGTQPLHSRPTDSSARTSPS